MAGLVNIDKLKQLPEFNALPPAQQAAKIAKAQQYNARLQGQTAGRGIGLEALPVGGAILGGTFGGPIGAAAGGGIGEEAAQLAEMMQRKRQKPDIPAVLRTAGEMGTAELVAPPLLRGAGNLVKKGGTKVVEALIPRSMRESELVQRYGAFRPLWQRLKAAVSGTEQGPRTVAQTITGKGMAGTEGALGRQALRMQRQLWNDVISPALRSQTERVNLPDLFNEVQRKIVDTTPELSQRESLLDALNALRDSYKGVKDVSFSHLQRLKQGLAKYVPEKAWRGKPIAGAFNDVRKMVSDAARQKIYTTLGPDIRQAYLDYGNLYNLAEHGVKAGTRTLPTGASWVGITSLKDRLLTPIGTIGGKVIYRTGQGMELVGPPGARVVGDVIAGTADEAVVGTGQAIADAWNRILKPGSILSQDLTGGRFADVPQGGQ